MSPVSAIAAGLVVLLVGFAGLGVAARTADPAVYDVGLAVFAVAVAFAFWLLKRWFDDRDRAG